MFYSGMYRLFEGNFVSILLPINILEDFTKPLSLSFRLFGNILADELVVAVLCFKEIEFIFWILLY